jgi:hypothetical protein
VDEATDERLKRRQGERSWDIPENDSGGADVVSHWRLAGEKLRLGDLDKVATMFGGELVLVVRKRIDFDLRDQRC